MSAVVNPNFVSVGNPTDRAVWATPDNGLAPEQLPPDFPEGADLENESEEGADVEEENYWEPRHIHVPRSIVWVVIALLCLSIIVLAVWGLIHSTWWYGSQITVDAGTTAYLARIRAGLAAAGAPDVALRRMAIATQPGANVDDTTAALEDVDSALEPMKDNTTIVLIRGELRGVLNGLIELRHWGGGRRSGAPSVSATPLPTLAIP
jgi:hypothetical protein